MNRSTRDLCQTCWQELHPSDYCPELTRYGTCDRCDDYALVVRSTIADEITVDGAPVDSGDWGAMDEGDPFADLPAAWAATRAELLDHNAAMDELRRFASFGRLLDPELVPAFVAAGAEVWSYQYGADDNDGLFTTLDRGDLETMAGMPGAELASVWGPFRATVCAVCDIITLPGHGHDPDPITAELVDELAAELGDPDAPDMLTMAGRLANRWRSSRYAEAVDLGDVPPSVLARRSTSPDYRAARRELVAVWSSTMARARGWREWTAAGQPIETGTESTMRQGWRAWPGDMAADYDASAERFNLSPSGPWATLSTLPPVYRHGWYTAGDAAAGRHLED